MSQPQTESLHRRDERWIAGFDARRFADALGGRLFALILGFALLASAIPFSSLPLELADSVDYAYAYASLHLLLLLPAIVLSALIVVFGWQARLNTPNFILALSVGFCAVGLMDLGDALSASGMPRLITHYGPDKNLSFQLAGHVLMGATLIVAAAMSWLPPHGNWSRWKIAGGLLSALAAFCWAIIFRPDMLPAGWTSSSSPTRLAVDIECLATVLDIVAAGLLIPALCQPEQRYLRYLFAAACLAALAQSFNFANDETSFHHLSADLYQLIAALLVCKSVFDLGIGEPYLRLHAVRRDLETSSERFRRLTELTSDWYWELDEQFRFTMSTGLSSSTSPLLWGSAVIGKTRWELPYFIDVPPAKWETHRRQLEAHLPFRDFELTRIGPDGEARSLSISGEPIFDGSGQFTGYRGVGRDITERKRTEALLAMEKRLVEMLSNGASIGEVLAAVCMETNAMMPNGHPVVLLYDQARKRLQVGAGPDLAEDFLKAHEGASTSHESCPSGRAVSIAQMVIVTDFANDPMWPHMRHSFLAAGYPACWSFPIISNDAPIGVLTVYFRAPKHPSPADLRFFEHITQLAALAIDRWREFLTKRRAEEALRRSELQHRQITDNLPISIVHVDLDHRILFANPHTRTISGLSQQSSVGRRIPELVDEATWQRIRHHYQQAFSGTVLIEQTEYTRPDGAIQTIESTLIPARNPDGDVTGCYVISLDITERVRADTEIRALNEELEARVRERTRSLQHLINELEAFSYSVSHDLRSPLRGIEGFMRIIEQRYADRLDDTGRSYLERVRRNSIRMGELIDDMLLLSDVVRGECIKSPVDLSAMSQGILSEYAARNPARRICCDIEEGIVVQADRRLLRIAMENLLGNAWKFTSKRSDANIHVGTVETDQGRAVFVKDNGAGFDMRYANKLFRSFQRLHTAQDFEGTGIGLAIVQRVVNRHGGRIWAEGKVGSGAAIYFVL